MTLRTAMALCCIGLALPSCGDLGDEYCREKVKCEGGDKSDVRECMAGLDEGVKYADKADCESEYFDSLKCLEEKSSCETVSPDGRRVYLPGHVVEAPDLPEGWVWGEQHCTEEHKSYVMCISPDTIWN